MYWVPRNSNGRIICEIVTRRRTMYHFIVKRIARRNFERVNTHGYETLLAECAPNIRHRFGGTHAMGGVRHDREALRRWFERLGRVSPTLHLSVKDVWVKGWPLTQSSSCAGKRRRPTAMVHPTRTTGFTSFGCGGGRWLILTRTRIRRQWRRVC